MSVLRTNSTARIVIYCVAAVVMLLLLGIALAIRHGESLLIYAVTPPDRFADTPAPAAPDYSRDDAWAARPASDSEARPADAFFVHTTTYFDRRGWNAPLDEPISRDRVDYGAIKHHASAFQDCCSVYAPRYRQANHVATVEPDTDGAAALDLAYGDVARAFDWFMAQRTAGRPLVLAGHGQGARHLLRLLETRLKDSPVLEEIAAVYLVGLGVPKARVEAILPVCRTADQTGCAVGWTSLAEQEHTDYYAGQRLRDASTQDGVVHYQAAEGERLCVNPLSWQAGGVAVPDIHNPGTLPLVVDPSPRGTPIPGVVGARCAQGALLVSRVRLRGFDPVLLREGDYHFYDIPLFFSSVAWNAKGRVDAFTATN